MQNEAGKKAPFFWEFYQPRGASRAVGNPCFFLGRQCIVNAQLVVAAYQRIYWPDKRGLPHVAYASVLLLSHNTHANEGVEMRLA